MQKNKKVKKVVDFFLCVLYNNTCVTDEAGKIARELVRGRLKPSGCGSAWLERLVWDQEVAGSNPVTPTYAGVVQW